MDVAGGGGFVPANRPADTEDSRPSASPVDTAASRESLLVVAAHPADADLVCSILEDAARWLIRHGIRQWPEVFPRPPVVDAIGRGEVYLALVDGRPAGTMRLQAADPEVWGETPDDALYVHRLAIRPAYRGRGLGRALLRWAEAVAACRGKRYLRLDCMVENEGLRRYYLSAGFRECGTITGPHWSARLFEKSPDPGPSRAEPAVGPTSGSARGGAGAAGAP